MAMVGDRIRLSTGKGANREGVVVAVTGAMVRVRWTSGEETAVVPAPGTLTVLTSRRAPRKAAVAKAPTGTAPAAKKAAVKKAAAKRAPAATKAAGKKAGPSKKVAGKKGGGTKRGGR